MTHGKRAERRAEIARLVAGGATPAAVAVGMGVSVDTVHKACDEHGVCRVNRERRECRIKLAAALDLLRAGTHGLRDAAGATGVSYWSLSTAAKNAGIRPPRSARFKGGAVATAPLASFLILAKLFDGAVTMAAVASEVGCTKQRVHQIYAAARAAGIPVAPRGAARQILSRAAPPTGGEIETPKEHLGVKFS